MELKLEQFIQDVEVITNIHSQNKNPILYRIQNGATNEGLVFFCGYGFPRYVVLPRNAIYLDYNPESKTYRHAWKRVEKKANPHEDKWELLYFYDDAMAKQEYDESDLVVVNPKMPPLATDKTHGIGYLTYAERDSTVIVEGDETLSNSRDPLDHDEMHPEKPASMISINGSKGGEFLPIADQQVPKVNQSLVRRNDTLVWSLINEEELDK